MNSEEIYIDFASKISFFEFIQDEFRRTDVQVENFHEEIEKLCQNKSWNINNLSDYIKQYPHSFVIFQEIFQLIRFTNAQLIHFVFDVVKLNTRNLDAIYEYMILNLKSDQELRKVLLGLIRRNLTYEEFVKNLNKYDRNYLITIFKSAITKYISMIVKDFHILEQRIRKSEFDDFSIRFSNYLLNNLKLNEILAAINVKDFIKYKKIPLDTKNIHGNYPKIKILKILEHNGYTNIDNILSENGTKTLKNDLGKQIDAQMLSGQKIFCTEKYVEGIVKVNDNKPKKFDLIIFSKNKPEYLFEINFYSTSGTKIGINQNEYVDLNNFIKNNFPDLKFCWITDGNYWLTPGGKKRFVNLLGHFNKVYNINLFEEHLDDFS